MKNSALIALALSGTALIGYVAYRTVLPGAPPPPVVAPAAESAPPAETLPEFTLSTLDGTQRSIHDWPGDALIINFWATWCAPCLREIPLLKEFQVAHAEDPIQVVGIAVDRIDPVRAFAEKMEFNYPLLVGQTDAMEAAAAFGVDFFALPFTVFTDTNGNVLGVHTGELHGEDLENFAVTVAELRAGATDLEGARGRIAGRR
jgi:thiol-disulfide isomerase/thioredoxin